MEKKNVQIIDKTNNIYHPETNSCMVKNLKETIKNEVEKMDNIGKNYDEEINNINKKVSELKTSDLENDSSFISGNVGKIIISSEEPENSEENDIWIKI